MMPNFLIRGLAICLTMLLALQSCLMKRIPVILLVMCLFFSAPLAASAEPIILHQWGENDRLGTIGELFVYDNPYSGKIDYFRLKALGSDGRYWYFPTDETDNQYWEYLPQRPAAAATSPEEIPHTSPSPPPKTPVAGSCVGCPGAQNIGYSIPEQPISGFDALKFTMTPMTDKPKPNNEPPLSYYWAYQDNFVGSGNTFYFGLQPQGEYGKTALFSVFGEGTSSDPGYQYCKPGADAGSGTSCHIPYEWSVGKDYDFTVTLAKVDGDEKTWEGRVYDVESNLSMLIGKVTVKSSTGIGGYHVAFDEYYSYGSYPCPNQPLSEILFFTPTGYYQDKSQPGSISSLNQNGGCNVHFYSDNQRYAYIEAGT